MEGKFLESLLTMNNRFIEEVQREKIMTTAWKCFKVIGSPEYSRCESSALHLVGPERCYFLCVAKPERRNTWEKILNSVHDTEASTVRKAATIKTEVQRSDCTG